VTEYYRKLYKSPYKLVDSILIDEVCLKCEAPFKSTVINNDMKNRDRLCPKCRSSNKRQTISNDVLSSGKTRMKKGNNE